MQCTATNAPPLLSVRWIAITRIEHGRPGAWEAQILRETDFASTSCRDPAYIGVKSWGANPSSSTSRGKEQA